MNTRISKVKLTGDTAGVPGSGVGDKTLFGRHDNNPGPGTVGEGNCDDPIVAGDAGGEGGDVPRDEGCSPGQRREVAVVKHLHSERHCGNTESGPWLAVSG